MEILESSTEPLFVDLRVWMARTGRNQGDLAREIDASDAVVSAWLSGKTGVSLENAMRISLVSGLPVEKLCTDRNALRILELWVRKSKSPRGKSR